MSDWIKMVIPFVLVIGFAGVPAFILSRYEMDGDELVRKSQIALRNRIRAYTEDK